MMNKKDLLNKVKSLEGLTKDEKAYLVNLVNTKKKYGLVWEDKPEEVEEQLRSQLPVLKEEKELAIISENKDAPNHILIEGDNLHALTALTFTHEGKIDVIYIDPPYNTGNKDFIYNDHYIDKDDNYRHSKWLSFMEKRLKIAKRLLKDDGLIFISIDDNQYSQLKLLCDEIFSNNLINSICVKTSESSGVKMSHTDKKLPKIKEYLLVYSKSKKEIYLNPVKVNKTDDLEKFEKYAGYYSKIIKDKDMPVEEWEIIPIKDFLKGKNLSKEAILDFKVNHADRVIYRTNNKALSKLAFKSKTKEVISATGIKYIWWEGKQMLFLEDYIQEGLCDLWTDISTINLNKEICDLPQFENGQKPLELIERIFELIPKTQFYLLDFFAGSGTSLHASIEYNKEKSKNIKCILVTNNENNIAREVTYERNKRLIQGYTNSNGEKVPGLKNNNLRYYKTDFVGRNPSLKNKRKLTNLAVELLCIKEDCYTDVTKEVNDYSWNYLFTDENGKYVYIVLNDQYIEDAVAALNKLIKEEQPKGEIKVYVFANGQYAYAEEFEEIAENISLAALPDAIYKAYQNVLPAKEREMIPELSDEITNESGEQAVQSEIDFDR